MGTRQRRNTISWTSRRHHDFLGRTRWLWSVWKRSSDLTLANIMAESESVDGAEEMPENLYVLARRLFYRRLQKIVTAALPGQEVGIDFVWHASLHATPGQAFAEAVLGQEGFVENVLTRVAA
jgi:hypothetical protein